MIAQWKSETWKLQNEHGGVDEDLYKNGMGAGGGVRLSVGDTPCRKCT